METNDENVKIYYPPNITQEEADMIFEKEWKRDYGVRLDLKKKGMESIAGYGSTKNSFKIYRENLRNILEKYEVKTFLDVGCADVYGLEDINFEGIEYIGIDLIDELLNENIKKYPDKKFLKLNIFKDDLPKCDFVFARDILVHISNHNIKRFCKKCIESGAKYLMTTTFPEVDNIELPGQLGWRRLNLDKFPFNFSNLEIISEKHDQNPEKCMGIYSFEDIKNKI